jgi:hypothetical protein
MILPTHPPQKIIITPKLSKHQRTPKMALPKLETASIAPPPPPTRLEQLQRFNANIKVCTPALQELFGFAIGALLGAVLVVALVTLFIFSIGAALFALY